VTTSLVVPCFQEAEALVAFAPLLGDLAVDEVVFVDDGSTDDTPRRLAALAALDPRVRVETHETNRGVGAAMRTGLGAARGDVVVVYDADRTYPVEDVARLVAAVGAGADVATASPFAPGGDAGDVPWPRRALSRGAVLAYRAVLGPRARGVATFTCAFRAYRRAWLSAPPRSSSGSPCSRARASSRCRAAWGCERRGRARCACARPCGSTWASCGACGGAAGPAG